MGRQHHHRFARWLRLAVTWAVAFHGSLTPWAIGPLYAQSTDTITIGFTAISPAAPAAITDLLASANLAIEGQISLTWTAPQGNAGGVPINNQPVAAYIIRYATFSVASLAGDTTSWWNAAAPSNVLLQSPGFTPKPPGQLEAYTFTGLTPGGTFYFGIKSISQGGVTSPIDTESASPNLQAWAVSTKLSGGSGGTPYRPNGLSASAFGGQFTLKWHPVTLDTNHQPLTVDHYIITRYDAIGSSPTVTSTVTANVLSYTDTIGGLLYYYRVLAVSSGTVSAASDYVDSTSQLNHYAIAPDDIQTRVVVPDALAQELNSGSNVYGEDLEIILTRRQQDEVDVTLRSYHVGVYKVSNGQEIVPFTFSETGMQVELGLSAVLGAPGNGVLQKLQNINGADAAALAQIISVYWFNGNSYIRVGDPLLTLDQQISVRVRNVGTYQIRAIKISSTFGLTQGSPYPRLITPNDPSQNNRVFWFFDNPSGDSVAGTIFDIRGAKVRDLVMNSQSPTSNSIVWDGRDNHGAVVRSGVYIYKITSGKEKVTGTVVVAR